jgi:hypothetical protein
VIKSLTREIGLLRRVATHLEWRLLPFETLTQELLRREGIGHAREKAGGIISIRMPGHYAFTELTDCLLVSVRGLLESFESVTGRWVCRLEPADSDVIRYVAPIREVPNVDDREPSPL